MNPYTKYKDSGIEWIGVIPVDWVKSKLKFFSNGVYTGTTPSTAKKDYFKNGHLNWFTPVDFYSEELKSSERKINQEAIDEKEISIYTSNCVYIVGIGATIGKVGFCKTKASCNQQINVIEFNNQKIDSRYGFYLLKLIAGEIINWSSYTTLPIFNQTKTKDLEIISPSLTEQTTIANFLDRKTTQIDETIAKKERLIELLEEERKAVINEAVTKGLNPNAKMKDSGIEWVGEIPEHWEVKKIRVN